MVKGSNSRPNNNRKSRRFAKHSCRKTTTRWGPVYNSWDGEHNLANIWVYVGYKNGTTIVFIGGYQAIKHLITGGLPACPFSWLAGESLICTEPVEPVAIIAIHMINRIKHINILFIVRYLIVSGWWFEPLWKILVNGKDDIPYIMENIKCSKPPTKYHIRQFRFNFGCVFILVHRVLSPTISCNKTYHQTN